MKGKRKASVVNFDSTSASRNAEREKLERDIVTVQGLLDICIRLEWSMDESVQYISVHAKAEPHFITFVWQKMEKDNPVFFSYYKERLELKKQIKTFNSLLQKIDQQLSFAPPKVPTHNEIHPMPVNNSTVIDLSQEQPPNPATNQSYLNTSIHGHPPIGNFHPISTGNNMVMEFSAVNVTPFAYHPISSIPSVSEAPLYASSSSSCAYVDMSALGTSFTSNGASSEEMHFVMNSEVGSSNPSNLIDFETPGDSSCSLALDLDFLFDSDTDSGTPGDYSSSLALELELLLDSDRANNSTVGDLSQEQPPNPGTNQPHFNSTIHGNFHPISTGNNMVMECSAANVAPVVPPMSSISTLNASSSSSSAYFSSIELNTSQTQVDTSFTYDGASSEEMHFVVNGEDESLNLPNLIDLETLADNSFPQPSASDFLVDSYIDFGTPADNSFPLPSESELLFDPNIGGDELFSNYVSEPSSSQWNTDIFNLFRCS